MSIAETTAAEAVSPTAFGAALRRLYFLRFALAVVWAGLLLSTAADEGAFLTTLLVLYPLFDAAAVLWQLRAGPGRGRSRAAEWVNVVVSAAVAVALGVASTHSIGAALAVWGIWAIAAGIPQLVTALRNRDAGGQVPQVLSGGISVLAGVSFLVQGLGDADSMAGAAGYATLGAVFFLISAIRLRVVQRVRAA